MVSIKDELTKQIETAYKELEAAIAGGFMSRAMLFSRAWRSGYREGYLEGHKLATEQVTSEFSDNLQAMVEGKSKA